MFCKRQGKCFQLIFEVKSPLQDVQLHRGSSNCTIQTQFLDGQHYDSISIMINHGIAFDY
uniref:Uncharacterized protein n=1 Tax=Arundo donax TaxID=35708 RepID=A0A0A8Z9F3_ARUDO